MIRTTLESIAGISIYPVFSFVLFFTFFAGMLVWVFRKKKSEIDFYSNLPLDEKQSNA
jgi:cytochrome c oxidase cbb3-type subunit IV